MACGCNKKKPTSNRDLIARGKKVVKKPMPLVTVRRETNPDPKKPKK